MCTLLQSTFVGSHGLLKKRNNLQQNLEELQKSMGINYATALKKVDLVFQLKNSRKMGLIVYATQLRFVTLVHLPFSVGSFDLFVASLLFTKVTSCCVKRRN